MRVPVLTKLGNFRGGIVLNFVDTIPKVYSQLRTKEFVPYLSMIDVLMNNTKDEVNDLLDSFCVRY